MTKRREVRDQTRELDDHGLLETLEARRQELLQLRLQQATGQLEHHRRVREVRRDVARILTLQGERARELAEEG